MPADRHRQVSRARIVPWLTLLIAGCASPGGLFSGTNHVHELLDSARDMRQSATPPASVPRELDKAVLATYLVEPGDALLVQPADPEAAVHIPADQPVLADGTINLGRYGRLVVAGHSVDDIETLIHAAVAAQTKNPGFITVRLVTRQSKVYYVLGDVNSPGAFPLAGRETVLDAIVAAGGLSERAAVDSIILSRPTPPQSCRIVLPVCYRNIVQLGDTSTNYQVLPGDRIFVPRRTMCKDGSSHHHQDCGPCTGEQHACGDAPATGATVLAGRPQIVELPALRVPQRPAPDPNLGMPRHLETPVPPGD